MRMMIEDDTTVNVCVYLLRLDIYFFLYDYLCPCIFTLMTLSGCVRYSLSPYLCNYS
jgi:hypothetical protein